MLKNLHEAKYQYLINKREGVGIYHFSDPKTFIEYSNDMHNIDQNIEEYNPHKENKILIAFDDMTADIIYNKNLNSIVTESFIRGKKINISLVFITQSYFKFPEDVGLNTSHIFIVKIPNKRELQQIIINHSPDVQKISLTSIENVQLNRIRFYLMMLHLHQIIL